MASWNTEVVLVTALFCVSSLSSVLLFADEMPLRLQWSTATPLLPEHQNWFFFFLTCSVIAEKCALLLCDFLMLLEYSQKPYNNLQNILSAAAELMIYKHKWRLFVTVCIWGADKPSDRERSCLCYACTAAVTDTSLILRDIFEHYSTICNKQLRVAFANV